MSALVAVAEVPRSRREWRKYVEIQIEQGDGWGPETELLRVLAGRHDLGDDGTVPMGVPLLMRKLKKSKSTVQAHLAALRDRGVLQTRQRGRRIPVHQLLAAPVEQQLSFFDDVGCGASPAAASADRPAASVATARSSEAADAGRANTATTHPSGPIDRSTGSRFSDPAVWGQRTATEEDGARERAQASSDVLSPSLPAVLEILERAPGLNVVDAAVNAALLAHRDADHERAAYEVASWAHEGGLAHQAANRLLLSALRRQQERSRPAAGGCRDRGRRRQRPVRADVPGTGPAAVAALREMRRAMAAARGEDPDA